MEYRFGRGRSAPRDLCSGALDARGFNPLPKEAPGGRRKMRFLRTARAISAHACRACLLSPPGFRPDVSGSPSGSVAKAAQRPRPALPARSPPPLVRSPAERPPPRRGEEKYAGGFASDASIFGMLVGGGLRALSLLGLGVLNARGRTGIAPPTPPPARSRVIPEASQRLSGTQGVTKRRARRTWVPALRAARCGRDDTCFGPLGRSPSPPRRSHPYTLRRDDRRAAASKRCK
jgi:hypothetical protein